MKECELDVLRAQTWVFSNQQTCTIDDKRTRPDTLLIQYINRTILFFTNKGIASLSFGRTTVTKWSRDSTSSFLMRGAGHHHI